MLWQCMSMCSENEMHCNFKWVKLTNLSSDVEWKSDFGFASLSGTGSFYGTLKSSTPLFRACRCVFMQVATVALRQKHWLEGKRYHKSLLPGCCPVFVSCVSTAHLYVCELVWLLSDRRNYLCSSCHIDGGSPVELCGVDTYAFLPHCTCSFCALNTQILYTCSCSHSLPYSHFSFYLFLMLTCTHCPPPAVH